MNIKNLFLKSKKPEDLKYAGSIRRSAATTIDLWIVLFLRAIVMNLLGKFWLEQKILTFHQEFMDKFGTETIKNTPEHIDFVVHSSAFLCSIIFFVIVILIGAFYHAYFNSSAWCGTIGKRLMKIEIVTENEARISFWRGTSHYFLSILPLAFIAYLMSYKIRHEITFFQAITASEANVFFGIMLVLWIQIHIFTKKKTTAYDMICNTVLINGRTALKFPWGKNKNLN